MLVVAGNIVDVYPCSRSGRGFSKWNRHFSHAGSHVKMNASLKAALHDHVRVAVHRQWDPIGVSAYSDEMGEYDRYVPELCNLIESKAGRGVIIEYLWSVETIAMGLSGDRPHTEKFADQLLSF